MGDAIVKTGQQAIDQAAAIKKAKTVGKQTTDRGTLITKSNGEMTKNSFLTIMVAQMKNQDPTQTQDSSALVTQMAQMSSMEQMSNLNDTMTTNAYQGLTGKGVTVDVADTNGNPYTGIVKGVTKENGEYYLSLEVNENGTNKYKVFDASKLKSVLATTDYTNSNMLINSDFMSASLLASDVNNKAVIVNTDATGTKTIVKGTVKSTYIDNGVVKVKVSTFDADGKASTETTDYPYSSVLKAGNLTTKDMDVTVKDLEDTTAVSTLDPRLDPTSKDYDPSARYNILNNSKTQIKTSSSLNNSSSSDSIESEIQKLNAIVNG